MPEATKSIWEQNATPRHRIQWCPGCGDFAVLNALKAALTTLELTPSEVLLVGGIGCSGQIRNYLNGNSFYGTHGGALAYALGAKMANPELTVFALAGDGDTLAIGIENFVHICRRDPDITLVIMDNGVYGLTKGQDSPSAGLGKPGAPRPRERGRGVGPHPRFRAAGQAPARGHLPAPEGAGAPQAAPDVAARARAG